MYYTFFLNEKNPNLMKTQPLTEKTDYEQQVQSTIHTKRSQNNKLFTEQSELFNKTITAKPQIISKLKRKGILPKKLIKSVSYPPQQQKTSQHKIMIQVVEQSFQSEILKITDDNRIKQQNPKMQIIEMIVVNKLLIDQTLQMIQKALAFKHRRNEVVAMIHDIGYLMLKLRNQDLKIITYLILAKISKYYKLNLLAINLAKFAKRFSDQEQYIKYKMYAYKILGQCMIGFKQDQAKIYITKYLMCSWKQNCKNDELKAYDLLGRYYYYEGNIQSAIIYHSKMADGETVNDESNLKRLGVAKLQQGSIGKSKKDKYFSLEEPDYQVSSDDEPFEIIFNAEDSQDLQNAKKNIENILKNVKRKSLLGYNLRKVANFDKNNEKRSLFEYKNANQFIRQPKPSPRISLVTPEGFLDLSKIKGLSRANVHLGNLKDHVLINHKSPNRCLVNYQFLELNKQTNSIKSQEFLEPLYEANDINKITKGFHKLSIILHNVREWLSDKMSYYEQM